MWGVNAYRLAYNVVGNMWVFREGENTTHGYSGLLNPKA